MWDKKNISLVIQLKKKENNKLHLCAQRRAGAGERSISIFMREFLFVCLRLFVKSVCVL